MRTEEQHYKRIAEWHEHPSMEWFAFPPAPGSPDWDAYRIAYLRFLLEEKTKSHKRAMTFLGIVVPLLVGLTIALFIK